MDRRAALKNLTMGLGYTIAAPTLLKMLASCTSEVKTWTPLFLTELEQHMVIHLCDLILPASTTPGALDVNVPQFLDMMYKEIETESKQKLFRSGAGVFATKFQEKIGKEALEGKKEDYEVMLDTYLNLSEEKTEEVLALQKQKITKVPREKAEIYSLYKFLLATREYTLYGYFTSEKVGEEVLSYDPIPGVYQGCIPLEDVGNAWSL
ncbi:gluconate 2-dehydrogenase subunit 3 family protein [Flavicella sediminum]|uniref:gluconate 2-dehydrogenase subunit 3 family protein n=1 Tax=Flavicella sediminum TaxID=2585141 RepID=UPI0014087960|nr:gluconate 2-dehydrogenase subunit 3 family protein [Flavicella sediminum]